ncbi:MAG: glucose-1-phosphate adenylyltransferase [Saprospiraceae bacterium]|nr:glucose-1-phosphate adenylyltransferase [Saprospiraceae bacterium]
MRIKMICLILGGGAGSRLYPLTKDRSKPAVPIAAKYRLIDIPISNCLNSGVKRMFVLTQFNSASLNRHIKNTYHFDNFSNGFVDILAAEQTPSSDKWYQGTADAVKQSMHHLVNQDFDYLLILSGDQLYQMNFELMARYHIAQGADITIATIPVVAHDATGFGIMKVNKFGFIDRFIEKPKTEILEDWKSEIEERFSNDGRHFLASMGIYIFNKRILRKLFDDHPEAVDFGKEIIPNAIKSGFNVASYAYDGYWTDIGTIKSFFQANLELTDDIPKFNLFDNTSVIFTRPRMLAPSKVFGTHFNRAVVAEGSIIHAKEIERSIIGIRSRIGHDTTIRDCIVMGNDYFETLDQIMDQTNSIPMGVGHSCVLQNAIIDKNCRIGNNVSIIGDDSLSDTETDSYVIRDGIIVLKKKAVIPANSKIGLIK